MSRLTRRIQTGKADCAYCTHEYTPDRKGCSPKCELWEKQMEKLAYYEDLAETGRLIELPCKVGDKVYLLAGRCDGDSASCYQNCSSCGLHIDEIVEEYFYLDLIDEVGEIVFLTKAEAEAKLAEMGGGCDEM